MSDDQMSAHTVNEKSELEKLAMRYFAEQRSKRRSDLMFRLLKWVVVIALIVVVLLQSNFSFSPSPAENEEAHIAVIDIKGVIADGVDVEGAVIEDALQEAFANPSSRAILLHINSPGGSPVQSSIIYDAIVAQKAEHDKPVYAVIDDVGASGAYYIAAAADTIYANKNSIIGSIGVIMANIGYQKLFQKLGLESRVMTAGRYKDIGNPGRKETPFEKRFLQSLLDTLHANFIADVKKGRGDRLQGRDSVLFSGLFWSAREAQALGLIDQLGGIRQVKEVLGVDTLVNYVQEDRFEALLGQFEILLGQMVAAFSPLQDTVNQQRFVIQ